MIDTTDLDARFAAHKAHTRRANRCAWRKADLTDAGPRRHSRIGVMSLITPFMHSAVGGGFMSTLMHNVLRTRRLPS